MFIVFNCSSVNGGNSFNQNNAENEHKIHTVVAIDILLFRYHISPRILTSIAIGYTVNH